MSSAAEDDDASPRAHWRHQAGAEVVGVLRESVVAFAVDRGLGREGQRRLQRALGEVLPVDDPAAGERRCLTIDAATDGDWLTVRISWEQAWAPGAAVARLEAMLDRLELDRRADGTIGSLLMELAMR